MFGSACPQGTLQESGQFWLKYCKAEGEPSANSQQEEDEKCPLQPAASGGLILQSHVCSEGRVILNNTKPAIRLLGSILGVCLQFQPSGYLHRSQVV